ncbi:MAG: hypothetical protein K2X82_23310 [Gemmataceae bacterium]|nr:hypothetical protein [Gemmataceae bacterium]
MAKTGDYDVWVSRIDRPFSLSAPFGGEEFALLLVVADPVVSDEERAAISNQIVRQGCRYAVCAGYDCPRWDDAIDWAHLGTDPDFTPPDERFVMTTWHEHDSLEEVAYFLRWTTAFDRFVPRHFLALVLGGSADDEARIRSAVEKEFR